MAESICLKIGKRNLLWAMTLYAELHPRSICSLCLNYKSWRSSFYCRSIDITFNCNGVAIILLNSRCVYCSLLTNISQIADVGQSSQRKNCSGEKKE